MLLLLVTSSLAQVKIIEEKPIEEKPKDYEWIDNIYHSFTTKLYTLVIWSNNEFEEKTVDINLGKTPQEAMESLNSLYEASKKINGSFKIEKYDCGTTSNGGRIIFFNTGDLEYTAGYYMLTDLAITTIRIALHEKYQDIFGKIDRVIKCRLVSKYGISMNVINLSYNETEDWLTITLPRQPDKIFNTIKFEENYILTDDDIRQIITWFEDGTLVDNFEIEDLGVKKKLIKFLNRQ